jgi:hypothetical protein
MIQDDQRTPPPVERLSRYGKRLSQPAGTTANTVWAARACAALCSGRSHPAARAVQEEGGSPHDPTHDGDPSTAGWRRHQYDPCLVGPCLPQYNEHLRRSGSANVDESPGELPDPGGRTQAALASRPGADGVPAFVVGRSVIGRALGSFRSCDKQLARRHNSPETASACRTLARWVVRLARAGREDRRAQSAPPPTEPSGRPEPVVPPACLRPLGA